MTRRRGHRTRPRKTWHTDPNRLSTWQSSVSADRYHLCSPTNLGWPCMCRALASHRAPLQCRPQAPTCIKQVQVGHRRSAIWRHGCCQQDFSDGLRAAAGCQQVTARASATATWTALQAKPHTLLAHVKVMVATQHSSELCPSHPSSTAVLGSSCRPLSPLMTKPRCSKEPHGKCCPIPRSNATQQQLADLVSRLQSWNFGPR